MSKDIKPFLMVSAISYKLLIFLGFEEFSKDTKAAAINKNDCFRRREEKISPKINKTIRSDCVYER